MHTNKGFTLIEVLVVVLILSVLAGIVGVSVWGHLATGKQAAARVQIKTFKMALNSFRADSGMYPTQAQGLDALCRKPEQPPTPARYPAEGYLDSRSPPPDPWGREYIYLMPGRSNMPFEVISYGADGEPGGEGEAQDISSSDL